MCAKSISIKESCKCVQIKNQILSIVHRKVSLGNILTINQN